MNQDGAAFKYICNKFHVLSQAKLKEGIFVGPQINQLLKDEDFDHILSGTEKVAGMHFEMWHTTFLEIEKLQIILNSWNTW